ncbi:probable proline--tRNA ligase, mitochondrial [Diaphorina citri]|uniref:Probable proline--tRNA ligase, mitochondrial n=1 Tax=Diaphorina citri TaxID=121845 RepID=A0A1S3CVT6_DIACI|nr:probable proline--tRNA ligase, mitochondrial [Diaphorina citri]
MYFFEYAHFMFGIVERGIHFIEFHFLRRFEGSKEAKFTGHLVSKLYSTLSTVNTLSNNVIVDDRTELTIGRRLLEAKLLGYPYIVVIGKAASQTPSLFEVIDLSSDFSQELSLEALYGFLSLRTSAVPVMKNKMSTVQ